MTPSPPAAAVSATSRRVSSDAAVFSMNHGTPSHAMLLSQIGSDQIREIGPAEALPSRTHHQVCALRHLNSIRGPVPSG